MWVIMATVLISGVEPQSYTLRNIGDRLPMETAADCHAKQEWMKHLIIARAPGATFERHSYDTLTVYNEDKQVDLTCHERS